MKTATSGAAARGTETVLLVAPDPAIRTLAAFMLGRLGYRVLEAHNAAEAMAEYDRSGGAVDLLMTEMRMPRVSGPELARQLAERNGGMRVLFMADPDYVRRAGRVAAQKNLPLLPCPFTLQLLAERVRNALDRGVARPKVLAVGLLR